MQPTEKSAEKEQAFMRWVEQYSDLLYSHCILHGFDRDTTKDLVQDTFYSAWKQMENFEGRATVKNWLFVILKNKITDYYRKASNRLKVTLSESDQHFDASGHWATPAFPKEFVVHATDPVEVDEFYKIFERCSNKLISLQRIVFNMKYFDDTDSETICSKLAITPNYYWTILHRAKVQLRACLEKNWLNR